MFRAQTQHLYSRLMGFFKSITLRISNIMIIGWANGTKKSKHFKTGYRQNWGGEELDIWLTGRQISKVSQWNTRTPSRSVERDCIMNGHRFLWTDQRWWREAKNTPLIWARCESSWWRRPSPWVWVLSGSCGVRWCARCDPDPDNAGWEYPSHPASECCPDDGSHYCPPDRMKWRD